MFIIITFLISCVQCGFAWKVIYVSQEILANDHPTCGEKMNPCRTINYPFKRYPQAQLILMIDGGIDKDKPFVYKINESIHVKFDLIIQKSSPAIPVIKASIDHFDLKTSIFRIISKEIKISSIFFSEFPSLFTTASTNLSVTIEGCHFYKFINLQGNTTSSLKNNLFLNISKSHFENFGVVFAYSVGQKCDVIFRESDFIGERNKTKKHLLLSNASLWLHQYIFSTFRVIKDPMEKISLVRCNFWYVLAVFDRVMVGEVEIKHSTFSLNQVEDTPKRQNNHLNVKKSAIILNCSFLNNVHDMGALFIVGQKIQIKNSLFRNNMAKTSGGALTLIGAATIVNCSFIRNKAARVGGALYARGNLHVFIEKCIFIENIVESIELKYNRDVSGNQYGSGGAIMFRSITFDILDSIFENNAAPIYGGTLCRDYLSNLVSRESTVSNSIITGSSKNTSLMGSLMYFGKAAYRVRFNNLTFNIFTEQKFQSAVYIQADYLLAMNEVRVKCLNNYKIGIHISNTNAFFYCEACDKDTYNLEGGVLFIEKSTNVTKSSIKCYPCPTGGICNKGIISKDNYWGYENFQKEVKFTPCPQLYCCSTYGRKCITYNTCEKNRKGRLCGECVHGFSESILTTKCVDNKHCGGILPWIGVSIAALVYAIIILYFDELTRLSKQMLRFVLHQFSQTKSSSDLIVETEVGNGKIYDNTKSSSGLLKIFIFFYQIEFLLQVKSSMKKSYKVSSFWTDLVSSIFNFKPSTHGDSSFQLCTWWNMDAVQKEVAKVAGILTVFSLLFFIYIVYLFLRRIYIFKKGLSTYEKLEYDKEEVLIANIDPALIRVDNSLFDVRVKCAILRFTLMTYIPITSVALKLINCVSIGDSKYLFICGKFECYNNWWQYLSMVLLAFWVIPFCLSLYLSTDLLKNSKINPVQFLKTFLFPPLTFYYCYTDHKQGKKNRTTTLSASTDMERLRLLEVFSAAYRPSMSNWIGMVIFRKFILTLVTIFTINPVLRLYLLILLLVIFLGIHIHVQPYKSNLLNSLESLSLLILIIYASVNLYWAHSFVLDIRKHSFMHNLGEVFLYFELIVLLIPLLALGMILIAAFSIFVWRNLIKGRCKKNTD